MGKEKVSFQLVSNEGAVVLQFMPVWARMSVITALSGIPGNVVRKLFNEHRIRAKKMDIEKANSACVFRVQDVLDWLDTEASNSPPFKIGG